MPKNPVTTNWNVKFDNKPTIDEPRIRFSEKFSARYLEKRTLILEIGCGTGSYTRLIDRRGCIGLDIDINAIKIAKKYCLYSEFVLASTLNLPFRDETFDLICMWEVLEEIPFGNEEKAILEAYRALKSNSFFLLSAPNDHIISNVLHPAFMFRGIRHYDLKRIYRLVYDGGFSVKEYTIRGRFNTIISNFLFYFYKHVLKKKEGKIKNFFNKKSICELNSDREGIVFIFVSAQKINR
jgi:ubiquinone/menaquinone biosynthesis C-methylase UbiE